ncbi:MAG: FAD-dependent oxidoreductase, partial [Mailhella sp.]
PHFCERTCTRKKIDAPVNIPAMEEYLGHWILEHEPDLPPVSRAGHIAVIGSGAAGVAAAYFMRRKGYSVIVYEKDETLGGQFRNSIPADILEAQIEWFKRCSIEFRTSSPVGDTETITVRDLRKQHAKAVIIATGKDTASQFSSVLDISNGTMEADPVTLATRTNGVFAAGPARGASHDPAHEIADAREAAYSANCFVDGWDMLESRPSRKKELAVMPTEKMFQYSQELPIGNLPASPRNEAAPGSMFNYETMILEANRCVTCGAKATAAYKNDCMTCYFCEIACPVGAILIDPFKERLPRTIEFEREGV